MVSVSLDRGRAWPNVLFTVGLLVAFLVFVSQLSFFARPGAAVFLTNIGYHAYVFVWMFAVTAFGRTLPLRILASAFLFGMFGSMAIALTIGFPLADVLGRDDSRFFDSVLVPLLEESAKCLPVFLYFWAAARRGLGQPSMTDGLLLGFLSGAGFALHEDAMYGRVVGTGFESSWGILFPTLADRDARGSGPLFHFYHAEWTAIIGLAIGAAFFLRHRFSRTWLIPLGALAVVAINHARSNYTITEGASGWIYATLTALDLGGRAPVYLLLLGIAAAVVTEVRVLRSIDQRDLLFKPVRSGTLASLVLQGGVAGLARAHAALAYVRARRSVHYALWQQLPDRVVPPTAQDMGLILAALAERSGFGVDESALSLEPDPDDASVVSS